MQVKPTHKILDFISKSDIIKIATVSFLVFVITNFLKINSLLTGVKQTPLFDILREAIALPTNFSSFISQPWSIITYMFSADGFLSLLFDMIWLWVFGSVIEDLKGMYRVLPIYLIGGILGAISFMLIGTMNAGNLFPYWYLGTLPALIAVVTATVGYKPQYAFWFYSVRIPIWALAIAFFVLKIGTLNSYHIQTIALIFGGITAGLLYNYGGIALFDGLTNVFKRISYLGSNQNFIQKKSYGTQSKNKQHITSSTIDAILDKINQKGLSSLNKEEKKILEEYSKEK